MANKPHIGNATKKKKNPKQSRTQQRKIALLNFSNRALELMFFSDCCVRVSALSFRWPGATHTHTRLCIIGAFLMASHFMFFFFFRLFADIFICFFLCCSAMRVFAFPCIMREKWWRRKYSGTIRILWLWYLCTPEPNNTQPTAKKKKKLNHYQFKCIRLPLSGYYTRQRCAIIRVWSNHEKRKLHKLREAFELNRLNHYWRLHK